MNVLGWHGTAAITVRLYGERTLGPGWVLALANSGRTRHAALKPQVPGPLDSAYAKGGGVS